MTTQSLALLTDLYQLTMAYGYWKNGRQDEQAVFHWFYRKNPFEGDFAIVCGLQTAIEFIENWHFAPDDIAFLATLKGADGNVLFEQGFLDYLQNLRFTGDIWAIPEGTLVFGNEPLLRVQAPLIQGQLLETALLTILNFQTLIATKAARIVDAAGADTVLEFGLRRAQGIDGGISASRAAYIGGCHATSNVLAAKLYDIPVRGTHAHSWVMSFPDERTAFETYANSMPNNCVFLVDTYNTIEGIKNAIAVGKRLRKEGHELLGIRLDSGDIAELSKKARKMLDEAGFPDAAVVASDDLDEFRIAELKNRGAKVSVWGVGTRLVTSYSQAALGGVYKLAAIRQNPHEQWQYKIKLSENPIKVSQPGILQVRRYYLSNGLPFGDMIWNIEDQPQPIIESFDGRQAVAQARDFEDLMQAIFIDGKMIYAQPDIHSIRQRTLKQIELFRLVDFSLYPLGLETQLHQKKKALMGISLITK